MVSRWNNIDLTWVVKDQPGNRENRTLLIKYKLCNNVFIINAKYVLLKRSEVPFCVQNGKPILKIQIHPKMIRCLTTNIILLLFFVHVCTRSYGDINLFLSSVHLLITELVRARHIQYYAQTLNIHIEYV